MRKLVFPRLRLRSEPASAGKLDSPEHLA